MRDNGFDQFKSEIRRNIGMGQDVIGIEYIQPFVFHGPHIEIIHRNDVEHVQIIFTAIDVFVPCHRRLERAHRKVAFVLIPVAHPYVKIDLAA